jgi:rRNA maturation endonuclease Nob1
MDFQRFPSVVQEVEEEYHLRESEIERPDGQLLEKLPKPEVFDVLNQINKATGIINALSPKDNQSAKTALIEDEQQTVPIK